jgi:hypothetical protein
MGGQQHGAHEPGRADPQPRHRRQRAVLNGFQADVLQHAGADAAVKGNHLVDADATAHRGSDDAASTRPDDKLDVIDRAGQTLLQCWQRACHPGRAQNAPAAEYQPYSRAVATRPPLLHGRLRPKGSGVPRGLGGTGGSS